MSPKQYVLQRFPQAKTAVIALWPDGRPRHVTILAGNRRLELPRSGSTEWLDDNLPQSAVRAWREAYYWCLKYPGEKSQPDLFGKDQSGV